MTSKKTVDTLCGAAMIAGALAAANRKEAPEYPISVDPHTGEPDAIVVVGANRAASDYSAATWVAVRLEKGGVYAKEPASLIDEMLKEGKKKDREKRKLEERYRRSTSRNNKPPNLGAHEPKTGKRGRFR